MISFYEFTRAERGADIAQADFLDTDYFYASYIDKTSTRRVETAPLTVADAFKKYVHHWFVDRPADIDCFVVRYEDLVTSPEETFDRVFAYLQVEATLARELLYRRVSQYSTETRVRAKAQAWQENQDYYHELLHCVEERLRDEIEALGYTPPSKPESAVKPDVDREPLSGGAERGSLGGIRGEPAPEVRPGSQTEHGETEEAPSTDLQEPQSRDGGESAFNSESDSGLGAQ